MALPGRDDTTRGAGEMGAEVGAVSDVGEVADDVVGDDGVDAVGAAGGVTTLVTTVAGGSGDTAADGAATGAVVADSAGVVLLVAGVSGAASVSDAADLVVFFARVVFGFASSSPVAAFLARFGLSTMGSPFKPFSSA